MKVVCVAYRQWAIDIYDKISINSTHDFLIFRTKEEYDVKEIIEFEPDYILYYGWSWFIPNQIIDSFKCIMLHPSPLPKYRGGSPLQNQIINGETKSAVTLFFMNKLLDTGDIILQKELSLEGHLSEIFCRITRVGIELTEKFLRGDYQLYKQKEKEATYCNRRKPDESEITLNELEKKNGTYLFNKIRMLEDPYPNAYIKTSDGKRLILKHVELENG